ncbi:separin isoform X1 [Onthophagus taurus]|uniref:separin isoform X1 n=2 Tax=Onthophagus taurus TaxID=166361 RepID=UPI0039BE2B70
MDRLRSSKSCSRESSPLRSAAMSEGEFSEEIQKILGDIVFEHFPCGPIYQDVNKIYADLVFEKDELAGIYYLKESHAPGLRTRAVTHFAKDNGSGDSMRLNWKYLDFPNDKSPSITNILKMQNQIRDMPEEWTIVQITTKYNPEENVCVQSNKSFTNDLFITVFPCGNKKQLKPFSVKVLAPKDVSGAVMNIKGEMDSIVNDNNTLLSSSKTISTHSQKKDYASSRSDLNNRLKCLIKDIQNEWLGGWRCLLIGTPIGKDEKVIDKALEVILQDVPNQTQITEKTKSILKRILLGSSHLKLCEIKKCVSYCFSSNETAVLVSRAIYQFSKTKSLLNTTKLNSVILIVEEKLDIIPFEMIDVLHNQPVTRLPSLHFVYALFKQYEKRIKNGCISWFNCCNGNYILNPDKDLTSMEKRIRTFIEKRAPEWREPTPNNNFEQSILNSDVFSYHGHGSGSKHYPVEKIKNLSIKCVVCLFGCGSTSYLKLGAQLEMYGTHQMYLLGCCPSIIGAQWTVTDIDTDVLSTQLFNLWLPPTENFNWNLVDRKSWEQNGEITFSKSSTKQNIKPSHEVELLRALCNAKRTPSQLLTQAAFVARGLPVSF